MLSVIIKNEQSYKNYLNNFLLPKSSTTIDNTKNNFIKSGILEKKGG